MNNLQFIRDKLLKRELGFNENQRVGYVDGILDMYNAFIKSERMEHEREREREFNNSINV